VASGHAAADPWPKGDRCPGGASGLDRGDVSRLDRLQRRHRAGFWRRMSGTLPGRPCGAFSPLGHPPPAQLPARLCGDHGHGTGGVWGQGGGRLLPAGPAAHLRGGVSPPPLGSDYWPLTSWTFAGPLSATLGAGDELLEGPALTLSTSIRPTA
jgi:hypothetical protein